MRNMGAERRDIPHLDRSPAAQRRLDAMAWRDGIAFDSFGVRIGIRTTSLARSLKRLLPPHSHPSSPKVDQLFSLINGGAASRGIERKHALYKGARKLAALDSIDPLLRLLAMEIRRTVATSSPSTVFVHAGVVGWRDQAIVLPGYSMSGKSTLVAELVKLGATYYSDEFAVIDEDGNIHPFAKPLSLRKAGSFEAEEYEIEAFGGIKGIAPIPVGMIAIARYTPEMVWRPQKLSRGQGLLALLSHSIAIRRHPTRVMRTLGRAVDQAVIVKSARGEASGAAGALLSMASELGKASRQRPRRVVSDFGDII